MSHSCEYLVVTEQTLVVTEQTLVVTEQSLVVTEQTLVVTEQIFVIKKCLQINSNFQILSKRTCSLKPKWSPSSECTRKYAGDDS